MDASHPLPDPAVELETQSLIEEQQRFVHSRKSWRFADIGNHLLSVSAAAMGPLNEVERLTYASAFRYLSKMTEAVEAENRKLGSTFEQDGLKRLREALRESTGRDLDPRKIYIHTLHMEFKESGWVPGQRNKRAYDSNAPLAHVYSLSLWQAACLNFGFGDLFSSNQVRASWINERPGPGYRWGFPPHEINQVSMMPIHDFVSIARDLDFGRDLKARVDKALGEGGVLGQHLEQMAWAEILFHPYEAYRNGAATGVTNAPFTVLRHALWSAPDSVTVNAVSIRLPDNEVVAILKKVNLSYQLGKALFGESDVISSFLELPLFTFEIERFDGVFSYYPNRLGGALRYHCDRSTFETEFKQQLKDDNGQKRLNWFLAPLSIKQQAVVRDIVTEHPRPEGLNAVTGGLYDAFHWAFPAPLLETLQWKYLELTTTPAQALRDYYRQRDQQNLNELAVERSVQDWRAFIEGASAVLDEVLGLLLLPVPGGLRGMGRVVQIALFGSLGYNFIQGLTEAAKGRPEQLAQSVIDIGNLLISAGLHRNAVKWSIRRHRELQGCLGAVHRVQVAGKHTLWASRLDRYVSVKIGLLHGEAVRASGVIERGGKPYGEFLVEGERQAFELAQDPVSGQYTLVHPDPDVFRPAVNFDPDLQRWQLALDNPGPPTLSQLGERLLPGGPLTGQELTRLSRISGSRSHTLQRVWAGEPAPAALVDTIKRHNTDRALRALSAPLVSRLPLPEEGDRALFSALTQLPEWPDELALSIHDQEGALLEAYGKKDTLAEHDLHVSIRRLADGGYVDHAAPEAIADHDLGPVGLILGLLPSDAAISRPVAPNQAFSSRAVILRRRVVDLVIRERVHLFEALSRYPGRLKSERSELAPGLRRFLPVASTPRPALLEQTLPLHPDLSPARVAEWWRSQPLSSAERAGFMTSGLLSEGPRHGLAQAARSLSLERALDGIYHRRAWNASTDAWAREGMAALLGQKLGMTLEITEVRPGQPVASVAADPAGKQVLLRHHGQGRYAVFDTLSQDERPVPAGDDNFYKAFNRALNRDDQIRLGINDATADNAGRLRRDAGDALTDRRTEDGDIRPWNDSALAYRQPVDLPAELEPDSLGLYRWQDKTWLPLDDGLFEVDRHPLFDDWGIEHPRLPGAYRLELEHNGAGAWWHEQEQPLEWEGLKLFRRLGERAAAQFDELARQLMAICDVSENQLRKVHVTRSRAPGLLMDTLQRVDSHVRVGDSLDRLGSTGQLDKVLSRALEQLNDQERLALFGDSERDEASRVQALGEKNREDTQALKSLLGNALERARAPDSDPSTALIRRLFPSLPEPLAREIVEQADDPQIREMETGKLPLALGQEARWWIQDVRLARALEGFQVDSLINGDNDRLALHLLEHLPGWPADLRIEIRETSASGTLLDSLGSADASQRAVIVKSAEGYAPAAGQGRGLHPVSRNLIPSIVAALPEPARRALVPSGFASQLRRDLAGAAVADRGRAKRLLGMRPEIPGFVPPRRLADGRVGYELSGGEGRHNRQLKRFRGLYSGYSYAEASRQLALQGEDFASRDGVIRQRVRELDALRGDLKRWRQTRYNAESRAHLYQFAKRIKQCWRRETLRAPAQNSGEAGYLLSLDRLEVSRFPLFPRVADFSHVTRLSMRSMRIEAPVFLDQFLRQFVSLQELDLSHNRLSDFPVLEGSMRELRRLKLAHNRIAFPRGGHRRLAGMSELVQLDLSDNPLGYPPDLDELHLLRKLDLHNTRIETLPEGIEQLRQLVFADLSNNRIRDISGRVFTGFAAARAENAEPVAVTLTNNPLSGNTRRRLQYFKLSHPSSRFGFDVPEVEGLDLWLGGHSEGLDEALTQAWRSLSDASGEEFLGFFRELAKLPELYLESKDAIRDDLVRHMEYLLSLGAQDRELRTRLFDIVHYGGLGDSTAFEIFRQMELEAFYAFARRQTEVSETELGVFVLARGEFRFFTLHNEVYRQNVQYPEERFRGYVSELGDLHLPPLFLDDVAPRAVDPRAVESMRLLVLHVETEQGLDNILMGNRHWQTFLKNSHINEHDRLFGEFFDYEPLEGETTQDYKNRGEALQREYLKRRENWLRILTRQALPRLFRVDLDARQD
ncbi:MAG: NEL-type E3 ubiquitin ligase domain-containing protein [Pseudomonas gingeri]